MRVTMRVDAAADIANPYPSRQGVPSVRPLRVLLLVAAIGCATTWDESNRTNRRSDEAAWECKEHVWELSGPGWYSDWIEEQKRKVCTRERGHELTGL
jgi:hypothetical protein